ncbi:Gfo/Idh/MocA family protein [Microlunatus parietis]|uniref:Putative dehydrogenase n=1 Tax=Microlunatus parietis TaxID=682979 RepID=A0A7Y9ICT7_9ACTN|nr:Gfo/Idh/MocA family oxidoreductase [Microlunatus parietis]NYE74472.1 putative dehydrogenase [Microlunatus parietis]
MRHRLAIIGCGGMEGTHATGMDLLADRLDIVATVDPVLERAEAAAARFPGARAAAKHTEVLDDIDAALVVTPHHTHYEIGTDLLAAGKHVLMEKPLALSESECLDLIEHAERVDRTLMVAYPMRYHPLVVELKRLLDANQIGEVFQISIWTEQRTQYADGHWAHSAATLGGGQLFSHGCHYIDLLLWFLGDPVSGTHVGTRRGTPWLEGEGTSNVSLEFANGALGYHFGTWGARGTKLGYSIHAHGTEAMLEADLRAGKLRIYTRSGVKTLSRTDQHRKYVDRELGQFLDCIEGKAPVPTDGPTSLQGLRVIWRLYQAERERVVADLTGLGFGDPWRSPGLDRLPVPAGR